VQRADEIDTAAWRQVCGPSGHPFLDPRFFRALEGAFAGQARFWYAILRDDAGTPVACAAFSRYVVDVADFAPPAAQSLIAGVRRIWPRFFKFHILLQGLPVSVSGSQLALAESIDVDRLCFTLNEIAERLARETKTVLISFKEFDPELAARLAGLEALGYRRARSVVSYHLEGEFGSFENYYNSRSKRTRANIRRHFRKLEEAGLTWRHIRGGAETASHFDAGAHQLYLNVFQRSDAKFERLPPTFFAELARQLGEDACFTLFHQGDRLVGFCCAVASPGEHSMIYCGLDYAQSAASDLYFNIIYRGLEQGLRPGVSVVHVGATADEFKQHMGCRGIPLTIYVKMLGRIETWIFNRLFGVLFDSDDSAPAGAAPDSSVGQDSSAGPDASKADHALPVAGR
jgi:predicted N-acyltransferase